MIAYTEFRSNIVSLIKDLDAIYDAKFEALDLNKALILISDQYNLDLTGISFASAV
jgi:hypothetical protein